MENLKEHICQFGDSRLLSIKVILDNEKDIYEGRVEDAPEEIKKLKYSKIVMGSPITYYVYSKFN